MDREEFIERCSLYALGALEGEELREFDAYLRDATEEERKLLGELTGTASLLPFALEQTVPNAHVKEQLLQKVALTSRAQAAVKRRLEDLPQPPTTPAKNWVPWGISAAIAMSAVFAIFVWQTLQTVDTQSNELTTLRQENSQLHARLVELKDDLAQKEEQLRVLSAKEIHISIMSGLNVNPVGYGKIIWDPERRTALLHVSNLPGVPTDKDYQLWIVKDQKKISAGVFAVQDTAPSFFRIDSLAVTNPKEIAAFAVTLEPKGGAPQPTGDMYMIGTPRL